MTLRVIPWETAEAEAVERDVLQTAKTSLLSQAEALTDFAHRIDAGFLRAVELILACQGRVVVSGIGKSGLIGKKIAATLACSGTPSFFVHPGEAAHGDLGMVTPEDVLIVISNSGETGEVVALLPHFNELGIPIIALVGKTRSSMARAASAVIDTGVEAEICPHNLVPTTSALVTLAAGDALAMAVMRQREFGPTDFGRFHPGGSLGRRLNHHVRDVMHSERLPLVSPTDTVGDALFAMTEGRCGLVIAVDELRRPIGIVTDGDLRRALQQKHADVMSQRVGEIMTPDPVTVLDSDSVRSAEERMQRLRVKALVVVDERGQACGVIEIFDGL